MPLADDEDRVAATKISYAVSRSSVSVRVEVNSPNGDGRLRSEIEIDVTETELCFSFMDGDFSRKRRAIVVKCEEYEK